MRKVTTYLLVFALTWAMHTFSLAQQATISGQVVDAQDGNPLPGATVRAGEYRGTTTNTGGQFSLSSISEQVQYLDISYVGYEKLRLPISTLSANPVVRLSRSIFTADEVVVNATRTNDHSGLAYTNVSAQTLEKQNLGQDIPVLLNFTPSLVSTSDAGAGVGYTGIRIRGTDATRINVTINGIPYNDAESQGVFWVNMPDFASSVSSIQIQRGVGTSTNGAGAFGATVNVSTNEFRKEPYAELSNSFGSFATRRHTVKAGTGLLNNKFTVDARLSQVVSDGFIDRAESNLQSYYLSGGYFGKKSFVRLNVFSGKEVTYQSWYGTPESRLKGDREGMLAYIDRNGLNNRDAQNLLNSDSRTYNFYTYENEVDDYKQDHYQLVSSHTLSKNLTFNLNGFVVRGKGFYEQFRDEDDLETYGIQPLVLGDQTLATSDLIRRRWLDNFFYGTTFSFDYTNFKKLTANIGGGWNTYDGDHFGEVIWARNAGNSNIRQRYYYNQGIKKDFNLYAKVYYQLTEKLNAFGDVQVRSVRHTVSGNDNQQRQHDFDQPFTFFNPKAGLNYQLSERSTAYVSYSIGNREPNRDDFTEAAADIVPKAETLRDLEAGFRTQTNRLAFSANYYFMDYRNQLVLTGQVNDVGNSIRVNVPKSYRMGLELEAGVALNNRWKWNVNATFSQNKIANFTEYVVDYDEGGYQEINHGKTDISFSPALIVGSQLLYTPVKNVELALLTKYVGKQYLDNTSSADRALDAYLTNDLRLIWTLTPTWAKQISLTALVNNVLDETYASNGYTYGYIYGGRIQENFYYPQAGRNFLLGLTLKF
ncbi:TonB-dependent receptor [Arundinibacter roseus]|uniref:TonB-dependent receptor n=1 Tax=Arundinibacter roseus TaxID=2070510 RepID=A0A4R4K106_9BACT|nr:TonB-dependent receptor [Arundinibacter roseus]TDB60793.1 TonB-dependent receptor [Arundinibacter roseus]